MRFGGEALTHRTDRGKAASPLGFQGLDITLAPLALYAYWIGRKA